MRPYPLLPRLALTLLLPTLLAFSPLVARAQGADPALDEAQRLLRQGQHAQALTKVDALLSNKPKDPQGRFIKGLILTEMKRSADAIAVFRKLTEDYPELPEPYNNLAVLYAQEKQYDKARQALESAIKTHPSYAVAHENLGDVYAKLASQAYGKALQIDASNTTAQSKMAMIRDLVPPTGGRGGKNVAVSAKPTTPPVAATPVAPPTPVVAVAPPTPTVPASLPTPAAPPVSPIASAPATAPVAAVPPTPPAASVAKPATPVASAKPSAPAGDPTKALQAWADAWSRKDVKAYLASYAGSFAPPDGKDRASWEREREARINKPGKIDVGVEKVVVEQQGDKAIVRFRQNYRSATLKTSTTKSLVFVRQDGRWLIQQEKVN